MNLFGIDLKPLLNKVEEYTKQQAQIIALLEDIKKILQNQK